MATDYLHKTLTLHGHREAVQKAVQLLRDTGLHRFDAIAWSGVSGGLVAPVVSYILDKPQLIVRKGEERHSKHEVESPFTPECYELSPVDGHGWRGTYVIIDDLVSSGATVQRMVNEISSLHPGSRLVFVVTYEASTYSKNGAGWSSRVDVPVLSVNDYADFARRNGMRPNELGASGNRQQPTQYAAPLAAYVDINAVQEIPSF